MNREFSFSEVLSRAKESFGCKKDKDLADILGISPQVLGNRKKTESIPYAEIVSAAMNTGADVQYILTGVRSAALPGARVLRPDQTALLDNVEHCAKEDQEAIKRMAFIAAKADNKDEAQQGKKKRA